MDAVVNIALHGKGKRGNKNRNNEQQQPDAVRDPAPRNARLSGCAVPAFHSALSSFHRQRDAAPNAPPLSTV